MLKVSFEEAIAMQGGMQRRCWVCAIFFLLVLGCAARVVDNGATTTETTTLPALNCIPADGETDVPVNSVIVCDTDTPVSNLIAVEVEDNSSTAALSLKNRGSFKSWAGSPSIYAEEKRLVYQPNTLPSNRQVCYLCNNTFSCREEDGGCFTTATNAEVAEVQISVSFLPDFETEDHALQLDFGSQRIAVVGNVTVNENNEELSTTATLSSDKTKVTLTRKDGRPFNRDSYTIIFDGSTQTLTATAVSGKIAVARTTSLGSSSLTTVTDSTTTTTATTTTTSGTSGGGSTEGSKDATVPQFDGIQGIKVGGTTSLQLVWNAGADNVSPSSALRYRIYSYTAQRGLGNLKLTSAAGATSQTLSGFSPNTQYCFVVRCVDEAGNEETNTSALCETTATDTTPPQSNNDISCKGFKDTKGCGMTCTFSATDDTDPSCLLCKTRVYRAAQATPCSASDLVSKTNLLETISVGSSNTLQDRTVANQTTYCYATIPVDQSGNVGTTSACSCDTISYPSCSASK